MVSEWNKRIDKAKMAAFRHIPDWKQAIWQALEMLKDPEHDQATCPECQGEGTQALNERHVAPFVKDPAGRIWHITPSGPQPLTIEQAGKSKVRAQFCRPMRREEAFIAGAYVEHQYSEDKRMGVRGKIQKREEFPIPHAVIDIGLGHPERIGVKYLCLVEPAPEKADA